ncbi:SGNH/GDSL hydrolase family protein [Methanobrevibacter olleyae]|nr:SGNH/GDSL hydrolase family protein [Methanobrevibacter olleyae]
MFIITMASVSASDVSDISNNQTDIYSSHDLSNSINSDDSASSMEKSDLDNIISSTENSINSDDSDSELSSSSEDSISNKDSNSKISSSSENIIVSSSDKEILSNSSNSGDNSASLYAEVYETTKAEYKAVTKEYTAGNIIYEVKAYDIVNYNGTKYKSPLYNQKINLRVYTGTSYKNYHAYVDNDGVASFKIPKLARGSHKVEIYISSKKRGTSYIKVIKASTKVTAPSKTVKLKRNSYFYVTVKDSSNNAIKSLKLKAKVYTGKKYKAYTIKTNSTGVAKLETKDFGLGTHKVIIGSGNNNYTVKENSKIIVKRSVPINNKLKVSSPNKSVIYKKGHYFYVTVKKSTKAVKSLKLKVKVYTGKKYKTYTIKTNSKGQAKLKTNQFALGTHKVVIQSTKKGYKFTKNSKIIVKKDTVSNSTKPATLVSLHHYERNNGTYYALLRWNSKKGVNYQVLRNDANGFEVISVVKANSTKTSFSQKVDKGKLYTYSVREIIEKGSKEKIYGPYDRVGLKLLTNPKVNVDFQNLKANVGWTKVPNATKYRVFRKIGRGGEYKCIAIVDGKKSNYTDHYYKSKGELVSLMSNTFIDSSYNDLFYTVRACNVKTANGVKKTSFGLYLLDGDFHLEAPSIVSLQNNEIKWGKVPNADGYLILKRNSSENEWEKIAQAKSTGTMVQSLDIGEIDNSSYYTVQAYALKNGLTVYSKYDEGFTRINFKEEHALQKILFIGDSITYGSPYKDVLTRHIFSIPNRVAQLLGCNFYNPSIPGSTYHDLGQYENGSNIENTNYYRYRITREVVDPISVGELPANWEDLDTAKNSEGVTNTSIEDYNIVVLAAGTNDYLDNSVLGSKDSNDTFTFNGALNHILGKIEEASIKRIGEGKEAIKVIFVDLYYSDRTYVLKEIHNRDTTPNKIGLLLTDYQKALDGQLEKWNSSEYLSFYNFKTRDYNIVNSDNCPYVSSDNLHFTKFTYGQYGNVFAQFLVDKVF